MMDEMCSMSRGIAKIMSFVLPLCLTAPLIWAGQRCLGQSLMPMPRTATAAHLEPEVEVLGIMHGRGRDERAGVVSHGSVGRSV